MSDDIDDIEKKEKSKRYLIDKETANTEFDNWLESWELDNEINEMNEEDKNGFEKQKWIITKAIRKKRLHFDTDDTMNYTFSHFSEQQAGKEIKIKRGKGRSIMAMDGYKEGQNVKKTYAIIAEMSGKTVGFFAGLDYKDIEVLQAIVTIFLAA